MNLSFTEMAYINEIAHFSNASLDKTSFDTLKEEKFIQLQQKYN